MATLIDSAATAINQLKIPAMLNQQGQIWSDGFLDCVETLQDLALNAADAEAIQWLTDNRAFIICNELAPVDLDYNGDTFTFAPATVYCCSPGEAPFFLNQAFILGFDFAISDIVTYLASGVVQTFFE